MFRALRLRSESCPIPERHILIVLCPCRSFLFPKRRGFKALEVFEISRIFKRIRKHVIALTLLSVVKRSGKFKNNCRIFQNTLKKTSLIFQNALECFGMLSTVLE